MGKNCLSIVALTLIYQISSTQKCVGDDDDYDDDDDDNDDNDDLLVHVEVQTMPPLMRPAALPGAWQL